MKLGPVTKLDKRKKTTSKKLDDDVTTLNCDAIVIFPIFGQFGAIRMPDAQSVKLTYSLKVTFNLTKTVNRTKNF